MKSCRQVEKPLTLWRDVSKVEDVAKIAEGGEGELWWIR
jgi:hypothetical protein